MPVFAAFYVSAEIFLIFLRFCTRFLLPFFSFRDILFMLVLRRERFFAVCRRITYGFFSDKAGMIIYEISFTNFARGGVNMSKGCNICGKGQTSGNNVSHSNRKTRRTFKANVQKVSYVENGKETKGYVCTRCLKKAERA